MDPTPEQPVARDIVLDVPFDRVKSNARVEVRWLRMLDELVGGPHLERGTSESLVARP